MCFSIKTLILRGIVEYDIHCTIQDRLHKTAICYKMYNARQNNKGVLLSEGAVEPLKAQRAVEPLKAQRAVEPLWALSYSKNQGLAQRKALAVA
jgi:hypothetical protein